MEVNIYKLDFNSYKKNRFFESKVSNTWHDFEESKNIT